MALGAQRPRVIERVFHLTFYKCGSQWVRDVLNDSRIRAISGFRLVVDRLDVPSNPWPDPGRHSLASPLYCASSDDWRKYAKDTDRAVVVVRDPRDIVVSLISSLQSSHVPSVVTQLLRDPLESASAENRLRIGMFLLTQWADRLRSWAAVPSETALVTTYSSLTAAPLKEFRRILDFLEWPVPESVLEQAILENAFSAKSGREPGQENRFSHWRKGISGDWINHFTRDLGRVFERCFPGLLVDLRYERSTDWWKDLPESVTSTDPVNPLADLQAVLEQHQRELAAVTEAATQRLADVEQLGAELRGAREELEFQRSVAQGREEQILYLHERLLSESQAAADRLRQIHQLVREREALESSLSYRYMMRYIRWIGGLWR